VFLHIPYAAGTSFETILGENFSDGVRQVAPAFTRREGFSTRAIRRLGDERLSPDVRVITGKIPFGARVHLPSGSIYVTLLRDPVARTLAHYRYLRSAKDALPPDRSLEATLAAGDLIHDNLQTRMLCDDPEPVGEVGPAMLEQAKENLRSGLAAFGIIERFDESVVLLGQELGLDSILYVREAYATEEPDADVPDEALAAVRRHNRYDEELYRFAVDLFEQRVAQQAVEFQVEVAALREARNAERTERPAVATADELWPLLVQARADVLRARLDAASTESGGRIDISALVDEVRAQVGALKSTLGGTAGSPRTQALTATRVSAIEEAKTEARRQLDAAKARGDAAGVAQAESRLESLEERLGRARTKLDAIPDDAPAERLPPPEPAGPRERLSPDVLDDRGTFYDAAEQYSEFLSVKGDSGRFLVRTQDKHIGRALFLKQSRGDMKLLRRCVTTVTALQGEDAVAGRVLIDVGANIGSTTVSALNDGHFSHVIALEPDPANFETLKLNVLLNGLEERTTAIQAAASDVVGELALIVNPARSGKHWIATDDDQLRGAAADESPIAVPSVTLDSLAADGVYDPAAVALLWIDAEHHEGHILSGATELTGRGVPTVFEWDPAGLDEGGGRELIAAALTGRYTHFLDMRATHVAGESKYRLRPIDELATYEHPTKPGDPDHFTEILALRLAPEQMPGDDLLRVLRTRGRSQRRRRKAA
jgi:FkbM family methyltransferase